MEDCDSNYQIDLATRADYTYGTDDYTCYESAQGCICMHDRALNHKFRPFYDFYMDSKCSALVPTQSTFANCEVYKINPSGDYYAYYCDSDSDIKAVTKLPTIQHP